MSEKRVNTYGQVQLMGERVKLALEKTAKIADITTGSANGAISVAGVDVMVKGLAALAYLSEVSETELSAELKAAIDAKAEGTALAELSNVVNTLIGADTGKSARTIANEELAKQLIPENASEALDTLGEVAAWIQAHPEDAAAMNKAISDLTALVGTLPEDAASTNIVDYIAEAIAKAAYELPDTVLQDSNVVSDEEFNEWLDATFPATV